MAGRCTIKVSCGAAAVLVAAAVLFVPSAPASAAGLFESFFGSLGRVLNGGAPRVPAYADPRTTEPVARPVMRKERVIDRGHAGPRQAFCVRTCDGGYFPVRAHAGMSVADACRSFCPGCETRLYYGSTIDHAVAGNGSRYKDLPNAYLYRKKLVAGCACNGHSAAGLAKIDPKGDPTLRRGDVIATPNGLVVYNGDQDRAKNFTPVQSYNGFTRSERAKLSELRVTPPRQRGVATSTAPTTSSFSALWAMRSNQSARLER